MQTQKTQLVIDIDQELNKQIQKIAKNSGCSIQFLVKDALKSFVVEKKPLLDDDIEIDNLVFQIKKETNKKFSKKKLPSVAEQLADL